MLTDVFPPHGVAHLSTLVAAGASPDSLERSVRAARLRRLRRGIYARTDADPAIVRAARIPGRVAGVTAAAHYSLWTPPEPIFTVEVGASASRLRDPDDPSQALARRDDIRVLWATQRRALAQSLGVAPLVETLAQVARTEAVTTATAVLDSALRSTAIDRVDFERAALLVPSRARDAFLFADRPSGSGSESLVRCGLRLVGIEARPQPPIPLSDGEASDLLIGDRLIVECQSERWHGGAALRRRDLHRHADLAATGFLVLEFDYWHIVRDLADVVQVICSYVDRGLHRSTSRLVQEN